MTKDGRYYVHVLFRLKEWGHIGWQGFFGEDQPKSLKVIETLRNCGWKGNDLSDIRGLDNDVTLHLDDKETNGHLRSQVLWVNRLGEDVSHPYEAPTEKAKMAAKDLVNLCLSLKPGQRASQITGTAPQAPRTQHRTSTASTARYTHKVPEQNPLPNPFADGVMEDDDIHF